MHVWLAKLWSFVIASPHSESQAHGICELARKSRQKLRTRHANGGLEHAAVPLPRRNPPC
jgi:hypothetical protein